MRRSSPHRCRSTAGRSRRSTARGRRPASGIALAAAAVALLLCVAPAPASQAPDARPLRTHFLSSAGLYLLTGGSANSMVFDRDGGVLLVDPKSAGSGPPILKLLASMTDQRVTTVVLTHGHPDHAGAIGEFGDARVVAHELTARRLQASVAARPIVAVTDKLSLFDAAPRVDLYYFGKGHTDGDLVVAFPESGLVHMGDLFRLKAAPVIDVANGGSGVAFPETLSRAVRELKGFRRVTTGHDIPRPGPTTILMSWSDLEEYAEFNRLFLEKVREGMTAGLTAQQTAARLEMPERFKGYDMQQAAANVAIIYNELGR